MKASSRMSPTPCFVPASSLALAARSESSLGRVLISHYLLIGKTAAGMDCAARKGHTATEETFISGVLRERAHAQPGPRGSSGLMGGATWEGRALLLNAAHPVQPNSTWEAWATSLSLPRTSWLGKSCTRKARICFQNNLGSDSNSSQNAFFNQNHFKWVDLGVSEALPNARVHLHVSSLSQIFMRIVSDFWVRELRDLMLH